MSKKEVRNQYQEKTGANVVEEIREQDLDGQVSGGGWKTAVQLSLAGRCGKVFTVSYECTVPHKAC